MMNDRVGGHIKEYQKSLFLPTIVRVTIEYRYVYRMQLCLRMQRPLPLNAESLAVILVR